MQKRESFMLKDSLLTSSGSICIPSPPTTPPLFKTRVQLELGEYVVQQAAMLRERGVSVHEISQIFTSIKLAAKVVNKIITKQGSFGLEGNHHKKMLWMCKMQIEVYTTHFGQPG